MWQLASRWLPPSWDIPIWSPAWSSAQTAPSWRRAVWTRRLSCGICSITGNRGAPLVGHTDRVNAVAFSPDGLLLASGASNENSHHPDNRVILWDVGTQRPFGQILTDSQAPGRSNLAMTVTPAGKTLLTSVSPDGVMLWDKEAGSLGAALNDSRGPVALSSNGQWVATGNRAHGITVWDVASRQPRVQFSLEQDGNIATPPSTSEEGATARSVETGAALDSIAFSPDSTILASLTSDGRLDL